MKLDYVFQNFNNCLIDQIRVDTKDRVFARIGQIVSTEDYAKGELIYVGQFNERPTHAINVIIMYLQMEFRTFLLNKIKQKYKSSQRVKINESDYYKKKQAKVTPSLSKIEDFLYSDLLYHKTRLCINYDLLKQVSSKILIDLEKYPAGYARWLIFRSNNTGNTYQYIMSEAPAAIKRLKYCLGFKDSIEYASFIRTNSRKDFYISHLCWEKGSYKLTSSWSEHNRDYIEPLNFNKTKEIIERIERNIKRKLNYYKDIKKHYEMIIDYIDFIKQQTNLVLEPNKQTVKDAIKWHNDGCPIPESCNKILYNDPRNIEELEQYRVIDSSKLYQLGKECKHCIYNCRQDHYSFYYKESGTSLVCAMVNYDTFSVIQCYDRMNKVTNQSKKFESMIRETLNKHRNEKELIPIMSEDDLELCLPF